MLDLRNLKEVIAMVISFVLDWASFALGAFSVVLVALVAVFGIAFAQYKRQNSGGRRSRL